MTSESVGSSRYHIELANYKSARREAKGMLLSALAFGIIGALAYVNRGSMAAVIPAGVLTFLVGSAGIIKLVTTKKPERSD